MQDKQERAWYENWGLLVDEACSDALVALKENDEQYAAALQKLEQAGTAVTEMLKECYITDAEREALTGYIETLISGTGTRELSACYLAGAGDGLRIAHMMGLLDL